MVRLDISPCFTALVCLVVLVTRLSAAIVQTGDVGLDGPFLYDHVGGTSDGSVLINAGSQLTSYSAYVGRDPGVKGTVTITDVGSIWTNSIRLIVGFKGEGNLNIETGGKANNSIAYLGSAPGSIGTASVTGPGSQWTNSKELYVGYEGAGGLTVANGGQVVTNDLYSSLNNLAGDGVIVAQKGAVLDADLIFDASHGAQQNIPFGSGGSLSLNVNYGVLGAGYQQTGSLSISDGTTVNSYKGYLGYHAGSSGTATVSGAGSKWSNGTALYVGQFGDGFLTVTDGGVLETETLFAPLEHLFGNGTILTEGVVLDAHVQINSTNEKQLSFAFGSGGNLAANIYGGDLGVGYQTSGSLEMTDGADVISLHAYLGYHVGSFGEATVSEIGTQWNNYDITVGGFGTGKLTVESGGQVSSSYASYIGYDVGSAGSATITGTDSRWTGGHTVYVGYLGNGTLAIEAGGQVSATRGSIGETALGIGEVKVAGTGSQWSMSDWFDVGNKGSGILMIEAGGLVSSRVASLGYGSVDSIGKATVTGAGSRWTTSQWFDVGNQGRGELIIEAGGEVNVFEGNLGYAGSDSNGIATVTGQGSTWVNRNKLTVGNLGSGTLTIAGGGLVTVGATLTIDHDQDGDSFLNMATGGMLALAGDADGSLSQFLGIVNGTDAIRYWDATLSNWSPLTAAAFGTDYTLEYLTTGDLAGYTLLTVGRVGDFDGDGDVDGRDFLAWQRNPHLGSLADWQNAYGNDPLSAATAVPEPSCLALMLGLILLSPRTFTRSR